MAPFRQLNLFAYAHDDPPPLPEVDMARIAITIAQGLFAQAAAAWLESRRPYISDKTFHEYQLNINTLTKTFEPFRLCEIDAEMIRKYQRLRSTQCGPHGVNHETSVLQQMLKRVGTWNEIQPEFQPLPLPKEQPGRVISDQEKERLLRIASTNPEWQAAYLFALISSNTGLGPKEVCTLRLQDVDLANRKLYVQPEGAKNIHRIRPVTLNPDAMLGVQMAMERAKHLGAVEPSDYLFPFRLRRNFFNPKAHQTSFKTAWKKITAVAKLDGLQMYDLRRTVATNLLRDPKVSLETATNIMGHIKRDTIKKYSYLREKEMREALDALSSERKKPAQHAAVNESEKLVRILAKALAKAMKS